MVIPWSMTFYYLSPLTGHQITLLFLNSSSTQWIQQSCFVLPMIFLHFLFAFVKSPNLALTQCCLAVLIALRHALIDLWTCFPSLSASLICSVQFHPTRLASNCAVISTAELQHPLCLTPGSLHSSNYKPGGFSWNFNGNIIVSLEPKQVLSILGLPWTERQTRQQALNTNVQKTFKET